MVANTVGVIRGDGIGPEIVGAAIDVIGVVAPDLRFEDVLVGHGVVDTDDQPDPLPDQALARIRQLGTVLKGPLESPKITGRVVKVREGRLATYPSINNALRQELGLFANVRPAVASTHALQVGLDVVLVREVSEGAYSGIEFMTGPESAIAVKLVTRSAWERIMRFSFDLAIAEGYDRVILGHKANVLGLADGMELAVARDIAREYTDVDFGDRMVDAVGLALVRGDLPRSVLVLDNQYGDILSDVAAGVLGSVGLAPGGNYGVDVSMFEACHGAAPDIAGSGKANPIAMILSGAMMLRHLGLPAQAHQIACAVHGLLEEGGPVTSDLGGHASTAEVVIAIVDRLECEPA